MSLPLFPYLTEKKKLTRRIGEKHRKEQSEQILGMLSQTKASAALDPALRASSGSTPGTAATMQRTSFQQRPLSIQGAAAPPLSEMSDFLSVSEMGDPLPSPQDSTIPAPPPTTHHHHHNHHRCHQCGRSTSRQQPEVTLSVFPETPVSMHLPLSAPDATDSGDCGNSAGGLPSCFSEKGAAADADYFSLYPVSFGPSDFSPPGEAAFTCLASPSSGGDTSGNRNSGGLGMQRSRAASLEIEDAAITVSPVSMARDGPGSRGTTATTTTRPSAVGMTAGQDRGGPGYAYQWIATLQDMPQHVGITGAYTKETKSFVKVGPSLPHSIIVRPQR